MFNEEDGVTVLFSEQLEYQTEKGEEYLVTQAYITEDDRLLFDVVRNYKISATGMLIMRTAQRDLSSEQCVHVISEQPDLSLFPEDTVSWLMTRISICQGVFDSTLGFIQSLSLDEE